jgi:hypothetical protein
MPLDVRGPRFTAGVTAFVVVAVLVTGNGWLALAQAAVFAVGAVNARYAPYTLLFATLVAPRLGPPRQFVPAEPVRFAQAVGFGFMAVAAGAFLSGATTVGLVLGGLALAAAFLNAAFGLCLGCEAYVLIRRMTAPSESR